MLNTLVVFKKKRFLFHRTHRCVNKITPHVVFPHVCLDSIADGSTRIRPFYYFVCLIVSYCDSALMYIMALIYCVYIFEQYIYQD